MSNHLYYQMGNYNLKDSKVIQTQANWDSQSNQTISQAEQIRKNPNHLHCVICSHAWLPDNKEKQTTRTYCFETATNRHMMQM